jgi:hypothetical protein
VNEDAAGEMGLLMGWVRRRLRRTGEGRRVGWLRGNFLGGLGVGGGVVYERGAGAGGVVCARGGGRAM